ncbi:hypothetical protein PI124_g22091 [Phytophthora idaei]|nr:hypothetical protein PI124_g22091 [Phytophthora idaei]
MQKRSGIGKVSPIYRCSEMSFLFDALLQEKTRDLKSQSTEETPVNANGTDVFEEVYTWVLQTNGQLDVSKNGLAILANVLRGAGDEVDDDASYHFTFSLPPIQDVLSFAACSTR